MTRCVIVIAYNEEKNIGKLLSSLSGENVIVIVDGNDRTASIAERYDATVIKSKYKRGYGAALLDGLVFAHVMGYTHATVMDVGTCDPDFVYVYTNDADIVVRARRGAIFNWRFLLSKVSALCLSLVTWSTVKDATFGYRTYNLQGIIPILSQVHTNGHSTNMEILGLALKNKLTVRYESVPYVLDENSQLKGRDLWESLKLIARLAFIHPSST